MTTPTTGGAAGGCGGDGCEAQRPWPLHHVRHRGGVLRRLCTSCVLKYYPGSFCTSCFAILDGGSSSPSAPTTTGTAAARSIVVHCCKCTSVAHLTCLPNPDLAAHFVCPSCKHPDGFSYFPISAAAGAGGVLDQKIPTTINLESAKVLLAAARLAAASMSRAAAAARVEAEKKVDVAVVARKRARDMLVSALRISKKGTEKIKELNGVNQNKASVPIEEVIDPRDKKRKSLKPCRIVGVATVAPPAQKSVHSREREKWMRFHEMTSIAHITNHGVSTNDRSERIPNGAGHSNVGVEMKDSAKTAASLPINLHHEEKKQLLCVKEEDEGLLADRSKDQKKPQSTQVASIS